MTTLPDIPERDARLSAAWREHSAEMPPAQLDAAILAAAHRAVGSVPRGSAPQDAAKQAAEAGKTARAATSPQRWWMPLAAAATIGAVALGILQTVPLEQSATAPSVSDMPSVASPSNATPRDKLKTQERKDAPRAMAESAAPQTAATVVPPAAAPANVAATPSANPPTNVPAKPAGKLVAPRDTDRVAPPSASMAAAPQPFPAEKKNESGEFVDSKVRAGAAPTFANAPAASPLSEPQRQSADAMTAQSPPAPAAPALSRMAAARDDTRQRNEVAQSAPAASGAVVLAKKATSADTAAAKAIDVDAWIVRIRKLHDDGKLPDAVKELVALRAAIPDADHRLPPELRAWAATVKP